jgi:cytochrome c oxidase cbb3-type subunit I/II
LTSFLETVKGAALMRDDHPTPPDCTGLIRAHGLAALVMVGYTVLLGLAIALKFHLPDLMGRTDWLTWGRLRYAHTQGVFFGWLGNAFLMFLYYAVPRLAERPLTSRRLGWALFVIWNFLLVIPGWVLVQIGISQPLEWGEFPLIIDAVVIVAFVLTAVQFVLPFLRGRLPDLYVSGWYILGGLIFTLLAYPVGNLVPEFIPGARGAAYSGLWIHDAIGLYVTPLALAIAYVVIPATTGRPIFSHFLSMVGFWLLFLVYPLNGTHHYVFSSIPMDAQKGAIVASVYLGVDVLLVVTNLLLSLRGGSGTTALQVPLRFVWVGVISYLIVSMQGSLQALMPVNRFIHFSDWVIGHSHLAMIGFASFTTIGGMLHVWERTPGLRYNARAANWAFWLLLLGMGLMVMDLTAAGMVQGQLWESDAAWMESVRASQVFWLTRSLAGIPIVLGFAALALSMFTGPVGELAAERAQSADRATTSARPVPAFAWLRGAYVITALAGIGFFALSFIVLAVWPNQVLEREIAQTRPGHLPDLSVAEQRGRQIYAREGCAYCHTQLVRFTEADVRRFGIASQAWESEHDLPQMWGTRRIGPDLARERGRKSSDWHFAHLWNPRHVVPESMMPTYPWLFDGAATKPTREALDLVAYLESLGRDAQLAGLTGPRPLPGMSPEDEKRLGMFCDCAIPRTVGPAPLFSAGLDPGESTRLERRGVVVFAQHCSGCHGGKGEGDGPAAEALLPTPRDLSSARFSDRALSEALWFGRAGSSMPASHDLSVGELRALVAYVQSLDRQAEAREAGLTEQESAQAQALFGKNCASCHGSQGMGADSSASSLAPAPTRFRLVRPTVAHAEEVLERGIPGTSMSSWKGKDKLSDDERRLLARYVRTFYRPE